MVTAETEAAVPIAANLYYEAAEVLSMFWLS